MSDKRFLTGFCLTVLWLGFMAYMLGTHSRPTTLEAWGEFFAGFLSPVAFLWLVLGYLQQGQELRNSSAALRLQADELRQSVEQQSQLVAVSRAQLDHELQGVQEERARRLDAARPKFVVSSGGLSSGPDGFTVNLLLFNVGNTATNLLLELSPPVVNFSRQGIDMIERNKSSQISIGCPSGFSTSVTLAYTDADGELGKVQFDLELGNSGQLRIGKVVRVEPSEA